MFGFRPEGRRVKEMDPIVKMMPYIMPMRCDAQVFLDYDVDYDPLMRFIAQKSREGCKITFMEIVIAAFVRAVSQVPEINRFIMNKQFFNRKELTVSFTLLLDTEDGSIKENAVKIFFDPSDTIFDVSARIKKVVEANRHEETSTFLLKLANMLLKVLGLPNLVVGLVKLLDRYGLCPKALLDILPFHTSMFITNNASIGLMRVYHHIYNFGNTSVFFGMGVPKRFNTVDGKGNVVRKCQLPIGITVDERVCAGATYAKFFAVMKQCFLHPESLETAPEKVFYNEGAEFHVEKPADAFVPRPAQQETLSA